MGSAMHAKVSMQWGDLPGTAFKVVSLMALTVHDDDPTPVYWGGWQRLAIVGLRRWDWPPDDNRSPEAERIRKRHWEAVRGALDVARRAGVISVKTRGTCGSRAEYWLHLDRPNTGKSTVVIQENPQTYTGKSTDLHRKIHTPTNNTLNNSQGEISTSSPAVPHQSAKRVVDNAKLTRLQLVRDKADAAAAERLS
jgi:hypothetical protein